MDTRYLMDTNAIIHFLGGILPQTTNSWLETLIDNNVIDISVINQIEVLGFDGQTNEMKILEEFVDVLNVLPLSEKVVNETIKLRRQYKIKLLDAIIAATALQHNLTVITQNIKDFQNIPNIKIINPHDETIPN